MQRAHKITKIKSAPPLVGEYKSTTIDKIKTETQLLLKSCNPKIICSKIELKSRGIKKLSNIGMYQISDSAWDKLKNKYSWMTDF